MASIELSRRVFDDFDRFLRHMAQFEISGPDARLDEIVQAIHILRQSPLIGRPTGRGTRELVIGQKERGYVVLYRYQSRIDTIFILAVRSQREAGYRHPD